MNDAAQQSLQSQQVQSIKVIGIDIRSSKQAHSTRFRLLVCTKQLLPQLCAHLFRNEWLPIDDVNTLVDAPCRRCPACYRSPLIVAFIDAPAGCHCTMIALVKTLVSLFVVRLREAHKCGTHTHAHKRNSHANMFLVLRPLTFSKAGISSSAAFSASQPQPAPAFRLRPSRSRSASK